jgi:exopolysaccharide biosynthesis protein
MFQYKKAFAYLTTCVLLLLLPTESVLAATQFPVSSGVKYTEKNGKVGSYQQSVRLLEVNLADPYTKMQVSYPNPLNAVSTTTKQAKSMHTSENRVVGAVNGSFFDLSTKDPMYLISTNNKLVNVGLTTFDSEHYVNQPAAFGVDKNGKALIDTYNLSLEVTHFGKKNSITSMNTSRSANELILYTSDYKNGYTNTNQYGVEVVFSNASKSRDFSFGDVITATVSSVRQMGNPTNQAIPKDGFVLSAHGDKTAILESMQLGEEVEISINIDSKWQDSQFMLASGPMLVNNGVVSLNMSSSNPRSRERAPRTAIATDKTQTKVYMITVDGRLPGYSQGMTLPEFANYLDSLGVYKALNLDGGGSTAMAVRKHGDEMVSLMNRPSDGNERAVSSTLQVLSNSPLGKAKYVNVGLSQSGEIKKGSKVTVELKSVLDQYYNPLPKDLSKLQITSTIGEVKGNVLTAAKAGKGTITAKYDGVTVTLPITIVEEAAKSQFSDVPTTYKFFKEINQLTSEKIINGYPDGTFKPLRSLSRVDAAILLTRALDLDTTNLPETSYKDVPKTYLYYKEIAAVTNSKIMNGKGDGVFDPKAPLTREEMAVILQRGFKLSGQAKITFTDVTPKNFGYSAISTLVANNLTEGFPDNTYRPKFSVTREQFSLFLYRVLN